MHIGVRGRHSRQEEEKVTLNEYRCVQGPGAVTQRFLQLPVSPLKNLGLREARVTEHVSGRWKIGTQIFLPPQPPNPDAFKYSFFFFYYF